MCILGIVPCCGEMFLSQDLFILLKQLAVRQGNQEETVVEDVDTCSNASPLGKPTATQDLSTAGR